MAPSPLKETVYKVAMSIPTEGHTLPEAYDNHLIHSQRIAQWEEKWKQENKLVQIREYLKLNLTPQEYKKFLKDNPDLEDLEFHPIRFEVYWFTAGRLLTQMARERLLREALNGGMDFCLMYDDDMVLPATMAQDLLMDMVKYPQITVLAPLAFMRGAPHYAVMYNVIEGFDAVQHQAYYINQFVKKYPKDKLVECDAVGFGAACIRLSFVKEKMKEPYFMSTTNTGEDIWFCVNAKQHGGRIFMDTRIKLGHLANPQIIDEEYAEKWAKDNKHDLGKDEKLKYDPIEEMVKSGEIPHRSLAVSK